MSGLTLSMSLHMLPNKNMPSCRTMTGHFGTFGTYDRAALQRGYQVCKRGLFGLPFASSIGLPQSFRPGYPEAQVKTLAAIK